MPPVLHTLPHTGAVLSTLARPVLLPLAAVVAALLAAPAAAQQGGPAALWVEGRVGAGLTLSSNGPLTTDARSEQVLEISPGIRAVANGARVKGSLDYSVRFLHHLQDTSGDNVRQALNAQGVVEFWDDRGFVDISGNISDQAVSAFAPLGGSGIADTNRSETTSFRFSPYVKGRLASWADYELRYAWANSNTSQSSLSDSTSEDLSFLLRGVVSGPLGWSAQLQSGTADYSLDRKTHTDTARLNLNYTLTPQLLLTAMAGTERNDVLTVQRESYSMAGVGFDWRPSPRSRLSLDLQDRYFGHSHNLQAEYRTGRTLWRLRDSRDVSNSPTQAATASVGTLYDLVDAFYLTIEPDPVKRAQLVQAELLNLGLPGDLQIFQSFLSSAATLARTQSLSAILQGRRTVYTATFTRSRTSRLQSAISLGDDFDSNSYVLQQGLSLSVGHRLTPKTSASADWSLQRNEGSQTGLSTRLNTLTLRLNTQLAPRTSGSLQLRRAVQDSPANPYGETSIAGFVNHRF